MNILYINTLPIITLNVTGRKGVGTAITVINQESKDSVQVFDFTYVQGETLTLNISDNNFLASIELNTTLSVILYDGLKPLYRDIVRFRGELNTVNEYTQYNNEDDYFIYESEQNSGDDPHIDYGSGDVSGSGSGTGTGSTTLSTNVSVDDDESLIDLPEEEHIISDYSVTYDTNNSGRGQTKGTGYDYRILETDIDNRGDFKVRSEEYGTFNISPSSLESVVVYQYDFNTNKGNANGYHPSQRDLSINPGLVNTLTRDDYQFGQFEYFHFRNGRDETFSDTLQFLSMREENSLDNSAFETTIYKEDSISDWTVGMSIYSDALGTSVTDNYVDSYANVDDLDRYHFISKNNSGVWVLVRCTDGIVTHVEAVDSVNYVRLAEMYYVFINSVTYDNKPSGRIATVKPWIESKLAEPDVDFYRGSTSSEFTTTQFYIKSANSSRNIYRRVTNLDSGVIGALGDKLYKHAGPLTTQGIFHKELIAENGDENLLTASDDQ